MCYIFIDAIDTRGAGVWRKRERKRLRRVLRATVEEKEKWGFDGCKSCVHIF